VGPRAGLDRGGKSRHPPGFDPRTVQLVASRYTDYATRPTQITYKGRKGGFLNIGQRRYVLLVLLSGQVGFSVFHNSPTFI
jgi:hypothetical protein